MTTMSFRRIGAALSAGVALAWVLVPGAARANAPENILRTPGPQTVTVTPSDNLSDQQQVTVTGAGFSPSEAVEITECAGTGNLSCIFYVFASDGLRTDASGNVGPISLKVRNALVDAPRGVSDGCTNNCFISITTFDARFQSDRTAGHGLIFGTGPTGPTTTTTTRPPVIPTTTTTVAPSGTPGPGPGPGSGGPTPAPCDPPHGLVSGQLHRLAGLLGPFVGGILENVAQQLCRQGL